MIDSLLNFDTDFYLDKHRDIREATHNMSEIDKKLWVLNHFVKHGFNEHRKYRLKSEISESLSKKKHEIAEDSSKVKHHKTSAPPTSFTSSEKDPFELIKKFRQIHGQSPDSLRDVRDMNTEATVKKCPKNCFWEVK